MTNAIRRTFRLSTLHTSVLHNFQVRHHRCVQWKVIQKYTKYSPTQLSIKQTVELDYILPFIYYCPSIIAYSKGTHCLWNPIYVGPEMKSLANDYFYIFTWGWKHIKVSKQCLMFGILKGERSPEAKWSSF